MLEEHQFAEVVFPSARESAPDAAPTASEPDHRLQKLYDQASADVAARKDEPATMKKARTNKSPAKNLKDSTVIANKVAERILAGESSIKAGLAEGKSSWYGSYLVSKLPKTLSKANRARLKRFKKDKAGHYAAETKRPDNRQSPVAKKAPSATADEGDLINSLKQENETLRRALISLTLQIHGGR